MDGFNSQRTINLFCVSSHKTCSTMALHYKCPHCLAVIKQKRNLILHFNSNPRSCPYRDPDSCLVESPLLGIGHPVPHFASQVRPSSPPRQSSKDDEQGFTPQDFDDSLSKSSSSVNNEDDIFLSATEGESNFLIPRRLRFD
jgi:hypothetical protein